jgi:O-antigen ligase
MRVALEGRPAGEPPSVRFNRSRITFVLAVVAVLSLSFRAVTVTGTIAERGEGIRLSYVVFGILGALTLLRRRVVLPRPEVLLFYGIIVTSSIVAYFLFPPRLALLRTLICFYAVVVGGTLGALLDPQRLLRVLQLAAAVFLVAVVIKDVLHIQAILLFLANPYGHPVIPTFVGGGPNLESTWLSMGGAFFIGTTFFAPYMAIAAVIAVLYASRVGVVIAGLLVGASLLRARRARRHRAMPRMRAATVIFSFVIAASVGAVVMLRLPEAVTYVGYRLSSIGNDPGSVGRMRLWDGGLRVFARYPLGVGQGNAVPELERVLAVDVTEDNLHNLYLQYLVEAGFPGLFSFLVFAFMTWRRWALGHYQDRVLLYVMCYLTAALIQFAGSDFLLWLIYGLHTGAHERTEPWDVRS